MYFYLVFFLFIIIDSRITSASHLADVAAPEALEGGAVFSTADRADSPVIVEIPPLFPLTLEASSETGAGVGVESVLGAGVSLGAAGASAGSELRIEGIALSITPDMHVLAPYPKQIPINRPIIILALDGGGIRGCVLTEQLLYVAERLHSRFNLPLHRIFDLVAGTSTGGLVASGTVRVREDGMTPVKTMDEINELYNPENAARIFQSSAWNNLCSWGGIWRSKYEAHGIESVLEETLGNTWLSEAATNTLITAVNMDTNQVYMFRSDQARTSTSMDFRMRDACRATSAAPTYFPLAKIRDRDRHNHTFADGGFRYNNPAKPAKELAEELYPGAPGYIMLSLGTGTRIMGRHGYDDLRYAGKAAWAGPLIDIMMEGTSADIDREMVRSLGTKYIRGIPTRQYFRTQVNLPRELAVMDTTSGPTIERLRNLSNPHSNPEIRETLDGFIDTVARFFPRIAAP